MTMKFVDRPLTIADRPPAPVFSQVTARHLPRLLLQLLHERQPHALGPIVAGL